MKRRLLVLFCASLFLLQHITPATAATKTGTSCSKLKSTTVSAGIRYTCIKSGTKLVWNKGVKVVTPTLKPSVSPRPATSPSPSPSPTPTPTPTPTPSATDLPAIRAAAFANNTFYADRGNCHSRGINAELQALEAGNWKRLVGAMGWEDSTNCPVAQPVQPWVAMDIPAGTTLRWRFWLPGVFDLNSATFMSLTKKVQTNTSATPVPTPSATATARPSVTPTPSATATRPPTVLPTVAPTPVALNQDKLIISNTNLKGEVGVAVLLGTIGGSGTGEVVYKAEGTNCFINGKSLLASLGTNCTVIATKAASDGYNPAVSAPVVFNFPSAAQSAFEITTGQLTFGTVGIAVRLATQGGSGSGAVSYSTSTPNCSMNDNLLLATTEATCVVTATKAASPGFNPITSGEKSFVFKAPVQALTITNINLTNYAGGGVFIRTSGGEGSGAVTISADGPYCTVSGSTVSNLYANSIGCLVTATKAASAGFAASVSAPVRFMFIKADQEVYICNDITTGYANSSPINLCAKNTKPLVGYGFNGSYSFSTSDVDCKIVGRELTASAGTTCNVIARVSGSDSYNGAQSPPVSFVFSKLKGQVEILNTVRTAPLGSTITLTANKFFRGPDATFSTTSPNCSITGNILSATIATSCAVQASMVSSKAVDYLPSLIVNFTFVKP